MLLKRIATASILIPLVVGAVHYLPQKVFILFLVLVAFLCSMEFSAMFFGRGALSLFGYPLIVAGSVFYGCSSNGQNLAIPVLIGFIAFAFFSLFSSQEPGKRLKFLSVSMLGFMYIYLFLPFFSLLRELPRGEHLIFFIAVTVYIGDTAAYFVGSRFGSVKLAPSVSPGKTVEGAVASTIFGTLAGFFYLRYFYRLDTFLPHILLPLLISTIGQVGDLVESLFKRAAGVKDSGTILPGHGGMLDRIDSLLLNAFVVFFFLKGV
jgi:phosphatidate cytidylyltransferase